MKLGTVFIGVYLFANLFFALSILPALCLFGTLFDESLEHYNGKQKRSN